MEPAASVSLFAYGEPGDSRALSAHVAQADGQDPGARAGDLVLEGYDCGPTVEAAWGDSDYEYWMVVAREHKDAVLLFLLSEWFKAQGSGRPRTSSELRGALEKLGIPVAFQSW